MSFNEDAAGLSPEHQRTLFDVAQASIDNFLTTGRMLPVVAQAYPMPLQAIGAAFVTLRIGSTLRGCMGSLRASEPLIANVARNAHSAAFRDPRFSPLTAAEFSQLSYHISVLSEPEPLEISSETDLLIRVRPGIDGLILYEGRKRGTLLPSVWEHVPQARDFLVHLKSKAGLPPDYWSTTIRIERYTAKSLSRELPESAPPESC